MEDYWDDYGPYDQAAEELKSALVNSVKSEVKAKIEGLESEVANLRERQKNLVKLEEEAQVHVRKAEYESKRAADRAFKATAKELLKAIQQTAFTVDFMHESKEKCDKCDENRKLYFTYPSGKAGEERCECAELKLVYKAVPALGLSVDIRWHGGRNLMIWYRPYSEDDDSHSLSGDIKEPYKDQEFSEVNRYKTIFYDESMARKYADYLNEKSDAQNS